MKLSELIREYVELKIDGEPKPIGWPSYDRLYVQRTDYRDRLAELEAAIDAAVEPKADS